MTTEEKIACARIVAAVILADGSITDAEHAFLEKVCQELGLGKDERRQATTGLSVGDPPSAAGLTDDAVKMEALTLAARAMTIDGETAKVERRLVDQIATALGLGADIAAEAIRIASLPKEDAPKS